MKTILSIILLCLQLSFSQSIQIPSYYQVDEKLSSDLQSIVRELELERNFDVGEDGIEQISLAVIDLSGDQPTLGGVNFDTFIYPASVYLRFAFCSNSAQLL